MWLGLKQEEVSKIPRDMKAKLLQLATKFPVVSVTGPRQSGKSTLIKKRVAYVRVSIV